MAHYMLTRRRMMLAGGGGGEDGKFIIFQEGNRTFVNGAIISSYEASYNSSGYYKVGGTNGKSFILIGASSKNLFDVSNYSKLCIECSANSGTGYDGYMEVGYSKSNFSTGKPGTNTPSYVTALSCTSSTRSVKTFNISSLTYPRIILPLSVTSGLSFLESISALIYA